MSQHIKKLISQGEHQQLDFKFEISDAKKIARTFSAFANTSGGTLLIGVKDNGVIAGIKTDEEIYMAEAAADLYCLPKVPYTSHNWKIDGKWVLELKIPKSGEAPHLAPWKENKKMAFIRIDDENHLANSVIYKVLLQKSHRNNGVLVKYLNEEAFLLNYLKHHEFITLSAFTKLMNVTRYKAERILVNLISVGVLTYSLSENTFVYRLNQ